MSVLTIKCAANINANANVDVDRRL